ncbi:MAG: FixH family protein [Bacteroidia bacterium]
MVHYGKFVFLLYAGFVLGMSTLCYMAVNQKFDMVTPNYYAQELKYQGTIDARSNANAFTKGMYLQKTADSLTLVFAQPIENKAKGIAHFYCPSDANNDKEVSFDFTSDQKIAMNIEGIAPRYYQVSLNWEANGVPYQVETSVQIK